MDYWGYSAVHEDLVRCVSVKVDADALLTSNRGICTVVPSWLKC